jgi:hypothetical protein
MANAEFSYDTVRELLKESVVFMSNMLSLIAEPIQWKEKLLRLATMLEGFTSEVDGVTKRVFPFPNMLEEEIGKAFQAVKDVSPHDNGLSFDTLLRNGINIPERLLTDVDESTAEAIFRALAPFVAKCMVVNDEMGLLKSFVSPNSISSVTRTVMNGDHYALKGDVTYIIYLYEPKTWSESDPIRNLANVLNHALGENLFEGVAHEGGFMMLKIKEADMQALSENPNLSDVRTILADPQGACSKRQIITIAGNSMGNIEPDESKQPTMLSKFRYMVTALCQTFQRGGGNQDKTTG